MASDPEVTEHNNKVHGFNISAPETEIISFTSKGAPGDFKDAINKCNEWLQMKHKKI